jgi:hypothetical protein
MFGRQRLFRDAGGKESKNNPRRKGTGCGGLQLFAPDEQYCGKQADEQENYENRQEI